MIVQKAMLDNKAAIHERAWNALDWQALAQHHFAPEATTESLRQVVALHGSKRYGLLSAWGTALLGRNPPEDSTKPALVCNISNDRLDTKYFEHFADEPSYALFSPSPLNTVPVPQDTMQAAMARHPHLARKLWRLKEPPEGNPFAGLLRSYGLDQISLTFQIHLMLLCIFYGEGRGLWSGMDLEVFEAKLFGFSELGFKSWSVFDLEHVSALQAWYLQETLPKNIHLERFCARGIAVPRGYLSSYLSSPPSHAPEMWKLPRPVAPVVRLVQTKLKDLWLYSYRTSVSVPSSVRVMIASFSWTECEMEEFLWYFNHILPLCDYLLLGYSTNWPQFALKYSLILQHMTPMEEYAITDATSSVDHELHEAVQEVAQRVGSSTDCVLAAPWGDSLVQCCAVAGYPEATGTGCWPEEQNRTDRINACCHELMSALIYGTETLKQEQKFLTAAALGLWLKRTFKAIPPQKLLLIVQNAMLKHKEAIHARAWDALDWRALAQHQFGLEETQQSLGEVIAQQGSKDYALTSAWGSALLGRPRDDTDQVRLICNVSSERFDPKHFEFFADEPAYAFFSPSPLNIVEVWAETMAAAMSRHPRLAKALWQLTEPPQGNPFAELLRSYDMHQVSLNFRTGVMAMCIFYGLGQRGAWTSGHSDLEVFEVGGGYGSLAWMAAKASLHARFSELGFKSWSIFDLEHVSALQAWYLRETLPKNIHLERFCAHGIAAQRGGYFWGPRGQAPESWQLPSPDRVPLVRLIETKLKESEWMSAFPS
ncbi:unnamed protein product [Durusdinium trenchii]|uniref:Uncharacterized protein n=1 Tax=Durusdinium trenchii TaxID=1381693 RepID=A0ABP0LJ79_9DINO